MINIVDMLEEVIDYIEEMEIAIDGEWGRGRDFNQLLRDKELPDLYEKILKAIKELS